MYIMHRRGWLRNIKPSQNQCKAHHHDEYHYHIIIACSEELDDNGFIIDHQDIADALIELTMAGSCELMHNQIFKVVKNLLENTPTELYAYKCILSPTLPNGPAYMEYGKVLTKKASILKELAVLF